MSFYQYRTRGEEMKYFLVLERTILFYVIITIVYRFMGKREVGELSILDLIVSILIAELAALAIDKYKESIFLSIIPMVALVIIQIILAKISLKNSDVRTILEGEPSVIINRGQVDFKTMLEQRYNLDDLLTQLRDKGIRSIEEVDYAILETSGKLSVFEKKDKKHGDYPLPIILDGKIQEDVLLQIKKDKEWLKKSLQEEGVNQESVFYAFYRNQKLFLIKNESVE